MSTLEEQFHETAGGDAWGEEFARTLASHRQRAHDLLAAERDRIRRIEGTLAEQMQRVAAELAHDDSQSSRRDDDLHRRTAILEEKSVQLERLSAELTHREQSWHAQQSLFAEQQQTWLGELREQLRQVEAKRDEISYAQHELSARSAALEAKQHELATQEQSLSARLLQLDDQSARLSQSQISSDSLQQSLREQLTDLATERSRLETERQSVALQSQEAQGLRRRIARELRAQRTEMLAEIERRQAESMQFATGEESQLRSQLASLASQADDLRQQLIERDTREQELRDQIASLRSTSQQHNQEFQQRDAEVAALRTRLAQRESDSAGFLQLQEQHAATLTRMQAELDEQNRTAEENRRGAEELFQQVEQHRAVSSGERAEIRRLNDELEELRRRSSAELAQATATNSASHDEQVRQLSEQLSSARQERDSEHTASQRLHGELEQARVELARLQTSSQLAGGELEHLRADQAAAQTAAQIALAQARSDQDALRAQLTTQRDELETLRAQLHDAEQRLLSAPTGSPDDSAALDDFKRRYEMSCADLKELKAKNSELSHEVSRLKSTAGSAAASAGGSGGAMDWEAQKRRMLEQLESDFDENDPQQKKDKLKIEEAIRSSSDALAERDSEIEELKKLLDQQSSNLGNVAVGAAAIAQMLNQDELIVQEREALTHLQAEWREKLKKAEVDVSLERAKLARQRQELEEKLQQFESERERFAPDIASDRNAKGENKPQRGRWLARLGLNNDEEPPADTKKKK